MYTMCFMMMYSHYHQSLGPFHIYFCQVLYNSHSMLTYLYNLVIYMKCVTFAAACMVYVAPAYTVCVTPVDVWWDMLSVLLLQQSSGIHCLCYSCSSLVGYTVCVTPVAVWQDILYVLLLQLSGRIYCKCYSYSSLVGYTVCVTPVAVWWDILSVLLLQQSGMIYCLCYSCSSLV